MAPANNHNDSFLSYAGVSALSCGKDKYLSEISDECRSVVCLCLALFPAGNATGHTLVKINFAFGRKWVGSDIGVSELIKVLQRKKKENV